MTTQITLPREVVEQLADQLASRCGPNAYEWPLINKVRAALTEQVQQAQVERVPLGNMTDTQRMEVFSNYCTSCGCKDPSCQCWNDE